MKTFLFLLGIVGISLAGCAGLSNQRSGAVSGAVLGLSAAALFGDSISSRQAIAASIGGATLGYLLAEPECTYRLAESSETYGTRADPWHGRRWRNCLLTGPAEGSPDFRIPTESGY